MTCSVIAQNYARIQGVEKELQGLQLQVQGLPCVRFIHYCSRSCMLHISMLQADTDVLVMCVSQLKLTSGPKRSALEMLRRKIEAQTDRVKSARTDAHAAQKVDRLSASGVGCCRVQSVAIRCREQRNIADGSKLVSHSLLVAVGGRCSSRAPGSRGAGKVTPVPRAESPGKTHCS